MMLRGAIEARGLTCRVPPACPLFPPMQVEPVMKTVYEEKWDWRVENENKPIWVRSPKDVSDEMYNDFYKSTFSEFLDPLAHVHFMRGPTQS